MRQERIGGTAGTTVTVVRPVPRELLARTSAMPVVSAVTAPLAETDATELALLCLFCGVSFGGMGLLCGSRVQTLEGVNGLINLILVPMWLFAGVFFSSERFPGFMQPAIEALPLTAANEALRAVMLDGRALATLPLQLAILAAWGLVTYVLALKIFRWK